MHVFLPHKKATHTMFVCPGGDPEMKKEGELPAEWFNDKNEPINFQVEFVKGKAEVVDKLGAYMIKRGLARKTKLILPEDA